MLRCAVLLLGVALQALAGTAFAQQPEFAKPTPFIGPEQPTFGKDLKLHASDLLDLNLTVEDKGASLTYAPLLYGLRDYHPIWSELRFKVVQADSRISFGAGVVLNPLSPRGPRGMAALKSTAGVSCEAEIQLLEERISGLTDDLTRLRFELQSVAQSDRQIELLREIDDTITRRDLARDQIEALNEAEETLVRARMVRFHEALQRTRRPVVSIYYSAQLFEALAGTATDADGDGLLDNSRQLRAQRLSLSADLRLSARLSLSGLASWNAEFVSAEDRSRRATVWVGGWTVGGIAKILNKDYRKSEDYQKSLFIPAAVWGFSHEFKLCNADHECPEGLTRQNTFTPFVDVKVKPAAQFRIGFPLSRRVVAAAAGGATTVAAIAAFTVQIGAPE